MNAFMPQLLAVTLFTVATATAASTTRKSDPLPQSRAESIALSQVPGGEVKSAEVEQEHGRLIWSVDIAMPASSDVSEIQIDAITGAVVSRQLETSAQQADEAASESAGHR